MSLNLNDDDYASDEDEEYVPEDGGDESEEDAGEDIDDEEAVHEDPHFEENKVELVERVNPSKDAESEKERIDRLWEDFCADTNTPTTSNKQPQPSTIAATNPSTSEQNFNKTEEKVADKVVEEIFNFAGEEVRIETKPSADTPSHDDVTPKETKKIGIKRAAPGLTGALQNLKKKKMSVLDKSDHDWNQFKEEKGISEELETHNKGRGGYIERMDFLTRSDYQQFEKEKDARKAMRKN